MTSQIVAKKSWSRKVIHCTRTTLLSIVSGLVLASSGNISANDTAVEKVGNVLQYAMPTTAVCATVFNKDKKGTIQFVESALASEAVVFGLKYTVHEKRPNGADYHSFPSGHTSITFTSAEFLRKRYGWWYGAPAYALAAFTGYSRIDTKWHYGHDVLAGAVIGGLSSYFLTTPFKKPLEKIKITVSGDTHYFNITLNGCF